MIRRDFYRGSLARQSFSSGVAHLLTRIRTPGCVWQSGLAARWGQDYVEDGARVRQVARSWLPTIEENYIRRFPLQDPERVDWFDEVSGPVAVDPALLGGGPIAYELVRAPMIEYGLSTLERINTWARLQPLDTDGNPVGPPIELVDSAASNPSNAAQAFPYNAMTTATPYPFPLRHPEDPDLAEGLAVIIAWGLWAQKTPITAQQDPALQRGIPIDQVPPATPWRIWTDMRYLWNSQGGERHQVMVNGHGILRMFAAIVTLVPGAQNRWAIEVGGRLTGFTQQSGVKGRANIDATIRAR